MKFSDLKSKRKEADVVLVTIRRIETEDGIIEYSEEREKMPRSDLPREAVHISGRKGEYALIDMLPIFPDYILDDDDDKEAAFSEGAKVNFIDAHGYYYYFTDDRMKKGYDAIGQMKSGGGIKMDARTIIVIGVAVIVLFYFLSRMFV